MMLGTTNIKFTLHVSGDNLTIIRSFVIPNGRIRLIQLPLGVLVLVSQFHLLGVDEFNICEWASSPVAIYSIVLLIMGEIVTRTCRVKTLRIKHAIVASCWTYFTTMTNPPSRQASFYLWRCYGVAHTEFEFSCSNNTLGGICCVGKLSFSIKYEKLTNKFFFY